MLLGLFIIWAVANSSDAHVGECSNTTAGAVKTTANSEDEVTREELREIGIANMDLLQLRNALLEDKNDPGLEAATAAVGFDHKYLLVRPCQRWAGDGLSGLPRHRVTGECCGDGVCSVDRWESHENCRLDCAPDTSNETRPTKALPPTQSALFGELESLEHDEYHCESMYDLKKDGEVAHDCSQWYRNESVWLEDLLTRAEAGTLPFELPPPGSTAVEFGCGKGQDSRNLAKLAGYSVTSIDVSPSAIEEAKERTPKEMLGTGASKIEFIAYDAFALPAPRQRVDLFFDATVYCGLRHLFLSRDYEVWSRLFTPGHTLVNIQCWAFESDNPNGIARARRDLEADFEPMFDILHSEACEKNQGGRGWCFYMKLKPQDIRKQIEEDRLKVQLAARAGDMEYVRDVLDNRSGLVSEAEYWSLYYIAEANGIPWDVPGTHEHDVQYLEYAYGAASGGMEEMDTEDQLDGKQSFRARMEVARLKRDWEKAELGEQVMRIDQENSYLKKYIQIHEKTLSKSDVD